MDQIKWSEIEAECGDYRAGFVATFRKYEGQPTDEKTKQGHAVKVTMASFARHMGIGKSTFLQWIADREHGARPRVGTPRDESGAKKVLREAGPETIEKIFMDLPPEKVKAIANAAEEVHAQQHEATAKRAPLGMPKERTYGFTMEMMGVQNALDRAIDNYVETWEQFAPDATEEDLSIASDLLAPRLLRLRMTVEGVTA